MSAKSSIVSDIGIVEYPKQKEPTCGGNKKVSQCRFRSLRRRGISCTARASARRLLSPPRPPLPAASNRTIVNAPMLAAPKVKVVLHLLSSDSSSSSNSDQSTLPLPPPVVQTGCHRQEAIFGTAVVAEERGSPTTESLSQDAETPA